LNLNLFSGVMGYFSFHYGAGSSLTKLLAISTTQITNRKKLMAFSYLE
jgi:hypothetical protein